MSDTPSPVWRFFGWLLMAAGALIAGAAGLCSAVYLMILLPDLFGPSRDAYAQTFIWIVPVVGGVPIAVGLALFFGGRAMLRRGGGKPAGQSTPPPLAGGGRGEG